jgi:alanine dehydrogenase
VPRTANYAINRATLPFVLKLADCGVIEALRTDPHLREGLQIFRGRVTHAHVAQTQDFAFVPAAEAIHSAGVEQP